MLDVIENGLLFALVDLFRDVATLCVGNAVDIEDGREVNFGCAHGGVVVKINNYKCLDVKN